MGKIMRHRCKFYSLQDTIGRDLGAAIDIGPVMSLKILKANGQVLYRTSSRSLTPDEIQSPTEIAERLKFDIYV
jgi:predicted RNase H-like nuclease (RuvC/YqgF family)